MSRVWGPLCDHRLPAWRCVREGAALWPREAEHPGGQGARCHLPRESEAAAALCTPAPSVSGRGTAAPFTANWSGQRGPPVTHGRGPPAGQVPDARWGWVRGRRSVGLETACGPSRYREPGEGRRPAAVPGRGTGFAYGVPPARPVAASAHPHFGRRTRGPPNPPPNQRAPHSRTDDRAVRTAMGLWGRRGVGVGVGSGCASVLPHPSKYL